VKGVVALPRSSGRVAYAASSVRAEAISYSKGLT